MEEKNQETENREFVKFGLIIAAGVGFILAVNYGPKYEIDGHKVKDKFFSMYDRSLVEYKKEGNKVKYKGYSKKGLSLIVINDRMYDSDDTSGIYSKGSERYHYLLKEIEKIKDAEKELRTQNQLERKLKKDKKRRDKINRDLDILTR